MDLISIFIVLVVAGLFLIGAEIFVPGAILGIMGGMALFGAVVIGFFTFGPVGGFTAAVAILIAVGMVIFLWAKYFPSSAMGKKLIQQADLSNAHSQERGISNLAGKQGEAASDLRPAGIAMIDGKRIDVVTRGELLKRGTPIQVIEVEGNRIVVRKI